MAVQQEKSKSKEKALLISVSTTFLSLLPTAYAALSSNSIVLLTDLLRCVVEFGAIFLSWLIMRRVLRGDRTNYDYGFGKLEQLASLCVAGALFVSFFSASVLALHRLYYPAQVENVAFGLVFAVLSVAGNITLWFYNLGLAKQDASPVLESQWKLFRAKACASFVVVSSLTISLVAHAAPWAIYADPLGSFILAGFLLYSAYRLLSSSMNDLLDRSLDEALRLIILRILIKHESLYDGLSAIRSRRSGAKVYIDIELDFSGERRFDDVYRSMETVRMELTSAVAASEVKIVPGMTAGHEKVRP